MHIKYIYNYQGRQESVVIPMGLWRLIQSYLPITFRKKEQLNKIKDKDFDPTKYYGMISYLNLDIEEELKSMRNEWNS